MNNNTNIKSLQKPPSISEYAKKILKNNQNLENHYLYKIIKYYNKSSDLRFIYE